MYDKKKEHHALVEKTMSKADIIRRGIITNTEKAKKNLSSFVTVITKSSALWSALIIGDIGFIALMFGLMLILQIGDPITSTYGLSYYIIFAAIPAALSFIGISFSLYGSKKSYAYRGVVIAALIFVILSLIIVGLGDIKTFITTGICLPIIGSPTTAPTNVWIGSISSALCGGSQGQKFIVDMIVVIFILLLHIFWIVALAILIKNSWKLEDINTKNEQINVLKKVNELEKKLNPNNDDDANIIYKMMVEDVHQNNNVSSKHVLHMGVDEEFARHVQCKLEEDDLEEEEEQDYNLVHKTV